MAARGALFLILALGLFGIGWAGIDAGQWVVAVAGVALGVWMGDLARRDLVAARARRGGR